MMVLAFVLNPTVASRASIGVEIIAEGVETEAERLTLQTSVCHLDRAFCSRNRRR
jgi:hypothetical protein